MKQKNTIKTTPLWVGILGMSAFTLGLTALVYMILTKNVETPLLVFIISGALFASSIWIDDYYFDNFDKLAKEVEEAIHKQPIAESIPILEGSILVAKETVCDLTKDKEYIVVESWRDTRFVINDEGRRQGYFDDHTGDYLRRFYPYDGRMKK